MSEWQDYGEQLERTGRRSASLTASHRFAYPPAFACVYRPKGGWEQPLHTNVVEGSLARTSVRASRDSWRDEAF